MRLFICKNCGVVHEYRYSSSTNQFYSNACQAQFGINERFDKWIKGEFIPNSDESSTPLKRLIILRDGYKCSECNITDWRGKPIGLEVEHKDGNSANNKPDNVCLLCPNCHSQTLTYKGKNRGNGRHSRRIRYKSGKSH